MAINFSVLKIRAISAIIFVAIMGGAIIWNQWSFFILFTLIQLGCLYEFQKLMRIITPAYATISKVHQWGTLLLGVLTMFAMSPISFTIKGVGIAKYGAFAFIGVVAFIFLADLITKKFNFKVHLISVIGLIYIPMSLSLFFQLRSLMSESFFGDMGFAFPLLLIISIWVNDTAAYLIGAVIGRKPLSKISPNKTWEGTIGGIIITVLLVSKTMGQFIPINENVIFLVSLVAAVFGTLGDLVESKLKRLAGVKDSGTMMPGHGGFLDRFDSILLATPFVWGVIQLVY